MDQVHSGTEPPELVITSLVDSLIDGTNLNLASRQITDSDVENILAYPDLEVLSISQTNVTSSGIIALSTLTSLMRLELGGLPVTDSAIHSLQGLTKLEHLDLSGSSLTNEGAMLLKMLLHLRSLNLSNCSSLHLFNFLDSLNVSNSSFGDDDMKIITKSIQSKLEYLDLRSTLVTTSGVILLAGNVPELQTLLLLGTNVDDGAIKCMTVMPSLRVIDLPNFKLALETRLEFTKLGLNDILTYRLSVVKPVTLPTDFEMSILPSKNILVVNDKQETRGLVISALCFVLENVNSRVCILAPTSSRVSSIHKDCVRIGFSIGVDSHMLILGSNPSLVLSKHIGDPHILVATPESFVFHQQNLKVLSSKVAYLLLDEADKYETDVISEVLSHFRKKIRKRVFCSTKTSKVESLAK